MRYAASRWTGLHQMVPWWSVDHRDLFADFGCGKGRMLYVAAWYRFGGIVGVEKSAALAAQARSNLRRARGPARLRTATVVTARVEDFPIPDTLSVCDLFNPFRGPVLHDLCARMAASVSRSPRRLRVVYANPLEGDTLVGHGFRLADSGRKLALYESPGGAPRG